MSPWDRVEVEALVADHLEMLAKELRGERFNKAEHRRALLVRLGARSEGSIERKHQNVSAILIALGLPYIDGYKPLGNYQHLLAEVVRDRVAADAELLAQIDAAVRAEASLPQRFDPARCFVDAPSSLEPPTRAREARRLPRLGVDYLAREAANRSLGAAGERFVVELERKRLMQLGRERLAEQVEQVSETRGDGTGFDVLSFDPDGGERFIEVKTTAYGAYTPFYVTRNELGFSRDEPERFRLYRLYDFRKLQPRLFQKQGPLDAGFALDAVQFQARIG